MQSGLREKTVAVSTQPYNSDAIEAYGELGITHGEGTEVLKRTFALLWWEEAVGRVLNYGAGAGSDILGSAYNDRHNGLLSVSMAENAWCPALGRRGEWMSAVVE